jgi:rhodanese-related sulfurtransferase
MTGTPAESQLEISVQDLTRLRGAGAAGLLVDVREAWETDICKIAGARLMPLSQFAEHAKSLDPDRPVYVYCHRGGRSLQAATWLRRNGFAEAASVKGGIEAWSLEIDPATPRY